MSVIIAVWLWMTLKTVAAWGEARVLDHGWVTAVDMYFDPSTGIQHVMAHYLDRANSNISYYQVDKDYKLIYNLSMNDSHVLTYSGVKITGAGNGKNLFAVLEGQYVRGRVRELDQLFTESKDGGKTWSPMLPVPRDNMNDSCRRTGQSILFVPTSRRLFIFYEIRCGAQTRGVSFVTRAADSLVFSLEKVLRSGFLFESRPHTVTAETSLAYPKPLIHVFWEETREFDARLIHVWSSDNGVTWGQPAFISVHEFNYGETLTTTSNPPLSPHLLGTFSTDHADRLKLFISTDYGLSFKIINATVEKQVYFIRYMQSTGLALCGTKDTPILYMLSLMGANQYEYLEWNLKTMTRQQHPEPFRDLGFYSMGVKLSCQTVERQVFVRALVVTQNYRDIMIYMAQDALPLP